MRILTIVAALLLAAPAYAQPVMSDADIAAARAKIVAAASASRANVKKPEEKAIVEADLAFAADCQKRGAAAAFGDRMHSDGKMFPARAPVVFGTDAVRALFKDDTAKWEWAPVQAVANGDLGVTWGIALISGKGEDGKPFAVTTRYTTVWRRDGETWKIWIDTGTPGPLP